MNKINIGKFNIARILMLASGVVIVTMLIFIYLTARDIQEISSNIQDQRAQLELQYEQGRTLKAFSEQLKNAQPQLEIIDQAFIDSSDTLGFINVLENLADRHSINQSINIPEITNESGDVFTVPVQLNVRGGTQQIIRYINTLDQQGFYFIVDALEITIPGDRTSDTSVTLQATTYWK